MINCRQLSKSYGSLTVLDSFSYTFEDTGFYLLFGESGSGKTTLLNVLSGMISYESGTVEAGGCQFEHRVDPNGFGGGFDYITQDAFFIDFLSVRENLKVALDDDTAIEDALERFGLSKQIDLMPTVLSGGERQRLALARSFLTKKKVLFLDEPTASLDGENKRRVFDLIRELSRSCLVICSSHDAVAKEYADEVIAIEKQARGASKAVKDDHAKRVEKTGEKYELVSTKDSRMLPVFMKKWFSSKRRSKKNDIFLGVFLALAMLLCLLADTPQAKLDSNIEYVYKINSLTLETRSKDAEYFASLEGKYGITDVVLRYTGGVPSPVPQIQDGVQIPVDVNYELILHTIPFDADSFRLSDKIAVGTYFQEKNDIILSSEMADSLSPGDWSSLLGMTVLVNVYGKGQIEFHVVGIMGKLNDFERQYLSSAGTPMSAGAGYDPDNYLDLFFVNSLFTDDYLYDETFHRGGNQRSYQIYFDSYKSLKEYLKIHDEAYGTVHVGAIASGIQELFVIMARVLLPLAFLIMLLSLMFYGNLIGTELAYNSRFISAFNYAGYDIREIIRCFIRLNTKRLAIISLMAAGITVALTAVVNLVNAKVVFIGFQIFTYNPLLILLFIVLLVIFSAISAKMILRRVKAKTWYENIIASRDLL